MYKSIELCNARSAVPELAMTLPYRENDAKAAGEYNSILASRFFLYWLACYIHRACKIVDTERYIVPSVVQPYSISKLFPTPCKLL